MNVEEFGTMIQKINYEISKEEIIEMFRLFDINKNEFLDLREMETKIIESKKWNNLFILIKEKLRKSYWLFYKSKIFNKKIKEDW